MVFPPLIGLWVSPRGYHPWGYHANYVGTGRVIQVGAMSVNWEAPGVEVVPEAWGAALGLYHLGPFGPERA